MGKTYQGRFDAHGRKVALVVSRFNEFFSKELLAGAQDCLQRHGLALAAGVTLYVAASNLVPEVQKARRPSLTLAFLGGAVALLILEAFTRTGVGGGH